MKKQIVFVLTELYSADDNIDVNVLGSIHDQDSCQGEAGREETENVLESYEQAFCGEYDVSEDHPTLFEITHKNEYIWEQLLITEKELA